MEIKQAKGIIERVFVADLAGTFALMQKKGIVELLEKGEENAKYKEMFEELEEMFKPGKIFYICKNKNFQREAQKIMDLKYIIDELKQKHFPEPVKKYITIEVESEKESEVDDGMEDIKKFVNSTSCPKMKISNYGYIEE